jgi:hypothetical protein
MVNCLRENFIYSEKRARDFIFSSIEAILVDSRDFGRLTLAQLTRLAALRARRSAEESGFEFATWDTTTKAVVNSMLGAGVLLTEAGTSVRRDIRAQATPIAALKEQYQDLTEAYLLECLIGNLRDIRTRDHKALAHALFRQFDPNISVEDLEDRVVSLLATLADRVTLCDDGSYAIRCRPVA